MRLRVGARSGVPVALIRHQITLVCCAITTGGRFVAQVRRAISPIALRVPVAAFDVALGGDNVTSLRVCVALSGLDVAFVGFVVTSLGDAVTPVGVRGALITFQAWIARGISRRVGRRTAWFRLDRRWISLARAPSGVQIERPPSLKQDVRMSNSPAEFLKILK